MVGVRGTWILENTVRLASRLRALEGKHRIVQAVHSSIHCGWSLSWNVMNQKIPTEPSRICWVDKSETSASVDPVE